MNLQMSISAKVDNIMTKIADYSVKCSTVYCISSSSFFSFITNNKTVQLIYGGHPINSENYSAFCKAYTLA